MKDNPLLVTLTDLTNSITSLPGIGELGVNVAEEQEKVILELHNHLGNVRQMVEASTDAFNGIEQFLILIDGQNELDQLGARLFDAHQLHLITDEHYNHLAEKILLLNDLISDTIDPEYT